MSIRNTFFKGFSAGKSEVRAETDIYVKARLINPDKGTPQLNRVLRYTDRIDQIFFYHMPKTAGIFIKNWLFRHMNFVDIFPDGSIDNKRVRVNNWNLEGERQRLFCYHCYPIDKKFKVPGDFFFTVIRHPVKMFCSHYSFVKYVLPKEDWDYGNPYDALIALSAGYEDFVDRFLADDTVRDTGYFPKTEFSLDFSVFDYIGVQETLEDDLKTLADLFGVPLPPDERANTSGSEQRIDLSYRRDDIDAYLRNEIRVYEDLLRLSSRIREVGVLEYRRSQFEPIAGPSRVIPMSSP